jgi:hypothetical protein
VRLSACVYSETADSSAIGATFQLLLNNNVRTGSPDQVIFDKIAVQADTCSHPRYIQCLNDSSIFARGRGYAYGNILARLKDENVQATLMQEIRRSIRERGAPSIRESFGRFFQAYLSAPKQRAEIDDTLSKLDAMVGGLKVYFILALPGVWATEDTIRILLDGPVEQALPKKTTFDAMLVCPTRRLCPDKTVLAVYEGTGGKPSRPPFWWSSDNSSPTPMERFSALVADRETLFAKVLTQGVQWDKTGGVLHPLLLSSIARLTAYTPDD